MDLVEYVRKYTERGECHCGMCFDKGNKPEPGGKEVGEVHAVDLMFFKVAKKDNPDIAEFKRLTKEHKGDFRDCDPFDGEEHGFMELGAWIGDQGLAMQYMGLGTLLGVFDLLTPRVMLKGLPEEMQMEIASQGMVTIQAKK